MSLQGLYPKGNDLRIDIEDWESRKFFSKYEHMQVGNEMTGYKLHVGKFTGNTFNGMAHANGMKFSTYDRDNDIYSGHCSRLSPGGWWNSNCHDGILTGRYQYFHQSFASHSLCWRDPAGAYRRVKIAEMKLRRRM